MRVDRAQNAEGDANVQPRPYNLRPRKSVAPALDQQPAQRKRGVNVAKAQRANRTPAAPKRQRKVRVVEEEDEEHNRNNHREIGQNAGRALLARLDNREFELDEEFRRNGRGMGDQRGASPDVVLLDDSVQAIEMDLGDDYESEEEEEELEEEEAVQEDEREEIDQIIQLVEKELIERLSREFPKVSLEWLLRNADRGFQNIKEEVDAAAPEQIPARMRERMDGLGVTSLLLRALADRRTFECPVCGDELEEWRGIGCVQRRRSTLVRGRMDGGTTSHSVHLFCAECIRGHAAAATEQNVIVRAGLGIKCMEPDCKGTLLMARIEPLLDAATRRALEPLVAAEALVCAKVEVERCKRCGFGAIMEEPTEEQPVFRCFQCSHLQCRKCLRDWKPHKNRTCEEMDPDFIRRQAEEALNEAMMRRCGRCGKPYVKSDGCNKVVCPCGTINCYKCKAVITGYEHFTARGGPCELHDLSDAKVIAKEEKRARRSALRKQMEGAAPEMAAALRLLK